MSFFRHLEFHHRVRLSAGPAILLLTLLLALQVTLYGSATAFITSAHAARPPLDVPYVPTPHDVVHRMLELAEVQPDDRVIDLGSGDGRIVIAAVRDWNVRAAHGIDLDPKRVAEARENAQVEGVDGRATFEQGNLFEKDFSDATVLTLYLLQSLNVRVRPLILERMAPGTRIVSHAFDMEEWLPDHHEVLDGRNIYLWIVPARVAGRWQLTVPNGGEIIVSLAQTYQHIEGSAMVDGKQTTLTDATLRGDELHFSIGADRFAGKVSGDRIVPLPHPATQQRWHAQRL